mmetsp:Transcript_5277/g.13119  ORF Transcript_5277/g.13119 Transcript_5277/m.13119 type:complete len:239 (+) Transcript_5277:297-1013(+)
MRHAQLVEAPHGGLEDISVVLVREEVAAEEDGSLDVFENGPDLEIVLVCADAELLLERLNRWLHLHEALSDLSLHFCKLGDGRGVNGSALRLANHRDHRRHEVDDVLQRRVIEDERTRQCDAEVGGQPIAELHRTQGVHADGKQRLVNGRVLADHILGQRKDAFPDFVDGWPPLHVARPCRLGNVAGTRLLAAPEGGVGCTALLPHVLLKRTGSTGDRGGLERSAVANQLPLAGQRIQ